MDTFDVTTWSGSSDLTYNPNMADVNDDTKIITDSRSKNVTNIAVRPNGEGFDLLLFHALKVTGGHVNEAEIVATWHFNSLEHMDDLIDKFKASVLRQRPEKP